MTPNTKQTTLLEKLLTEREAARILGCSLRTVRRRVDAGELATIRDGRLVRVHPEDLRRYIQRRRFG